MTAIAQAQDDDAELVERVARAIFGVEYSGGRAIPQVEPPWCIYRRAARAAITATRLSVTTPDTTVLVELRKALAGVSIKLRGSSNHGCTVECHLPGSGRGRAAMRLQDCLRALASTANPTGETSNG